MKRLVAALSGALVALGGTVALAPSAQAASYTQSQSVYRTWVSTSPALGVCARYTLNATMTFVTTYSPAQTTYPTKPSGYMVSNAKLYNPVLGVKTYAYTTSGGCSSTLKSVSKITFAQHWGGNSCSFNPSVQVSIPWGIGISAWPSCGTRYQTNRTSSFGSGSSFTQNNSNNGSPVATWAGSLAFRTGSAPANPCLSVFVDSVITRGTSDDAFGINETSARAVCLVASYR